jgi:superfamily II DNA helicase RecQ
MKDIQNKLTQVFSDYPDALDNHRKLSGLLRDFFHMQNEEKLVRILLNLHKEGIQTEISKEHILTVPFAYKFTLRLTSRYGINEDIAYSAVLLWCICYGTNILGKKCDLPKGYKDLMVQNPPALPIAPTAPKATESHPDIAEQSTSREYDDYFVNVSLTKQQDKVYIPCSFSETDCGYYICGIKESNNCNHKYASVYALIYNYIIRNSRMSDEDKPHYFEKIRTTFQIDYLKVFRLETIILQLIKNNMISGQNVNVRNKTTSELQYAIDVINDYAELFCRLIGIKYSPLKLVSDTSGILIGVKTGVHLEKSTIACNARELWFGKKINYQLTDANKVDLEYLLREISPYDTFKDGQYESLTNMLSSAKHSVCILPTGSGKSLIFYMASLLQPAPLFVVVPTEILIRDQIRNLQKIHRFDNVSHLQLKANMDFRDLDAHNSLLYLTPATFQNRKLLSSFRQLNDNLQVSYVVLDEIHCSSNWGHDFRPEFLMLAQNLRTFVTRTTFLGFTATANYTVIEDICKQLSIQKENVFSPIAYEKFNIAYDFRKVENSRELFQEVCDIVSGSIRRNERTIVFTKNDRASKKIAQMIGYEADVLMSDNIEAYHTFADEKSRVLVASEEIGIGINLPNVKNVVHLGIPISKNEYVQEIGRAGRADENVTSFVVYIDKTATSLPQELFMRNTGMDTFQIDTKSNDNDYMLAYRKLCAGIDSKEILLSDLVDMYLEFDGEQRAICTREYTTAAFNTAKKQIYILFAIGYISDWYTWEADELKEMIKIFVCITSTNHHDYVASGGKRMLDRVKKRAAKYFDSLGNAREQIGKIQWAEKVEDVIEIYVDWYYSKFLHNHREMFLDFLDFVESNTGKESFHITQDIKDYFTLPFVKIKSDEAKYANLSIGEIANRVSHGIGRDTIVSIERLNSDQYSYNYDVLLFLAKMRIDQQCDVNRLDRILSRTDRKARAELLDAFVKVYPYCDKTTRFALLRKLREWLSSAQEFAKLFEVIYNVCDKDIIFYGFVASNINVKFQPLRRA